ncbi:MAG: hypothetical protein IIY45_10360 [Firmicutes bacterium]|nr:hypothetical protein [Bacillota bacterium]
MEPDIRKIRFTNEDRPSSVNVKDASIGLDLDVSIVFEGIVSFRMTEPGRGDMSDALRDSTMNFARMSVQSLKPEEIDGRNLAPSQEAFHQMTKQKLENQWSGHGIEIIDLEITRFFIQESDRNMLDRIYRMAEFRDPAKAAKLLEEQQEKLREMNIQTAKELAKMGPSKWKCPKCGTLNSAKFCMECGKKREWTCDCGTVNLGRFCTECGKPRALAKLEKKK